MARVSKKNPEKLFELVSALEGRPLSLKAVEAAAARAGFRQDNARLRRSLALTRAAIAALKRAMPDASANTIGDMVAALSDLWETGQVLDKRLKKLTRMRFPQDAENLRDTLIWIDAIQVDMATYWIKVVQKSLPKLLAALERQGQRLRRRESRRR